VTVRESYHDPMTKLLLRLMSYVPLVNERTLMVGVKGKKIATKNKGPIDSNKILFIETRFRDAAIGRHINMEPNLELEDILVQ